MSTTMIDTTTAMTAIHRKGHGGEALLQEGAHLTRISFIERADGVSTEMVITFLA